MITHIKALNDRIKALLEQFPENPLLDKLLKIIDAVTFPGKKSNDGNIGICNKPAGNAAQDSTSILLTSLKQSTRRLPPRTTRLAGNSVTTAKYSVVTDFPNKSLIEHQVLT